MSYLLFCFVVWLRLSLHQSEFCSPEFCFVFEIEKWQGLFACCGNTQQTAISGEKRMSTIWYHSDYYKCAYSTQHTPNLIIKMSKRMKLYGALGQSWNNNYCQLKHHFVLLSLRILVSNTQNENWVTTFL